MRGLLLQMKSIVYCNPFVPPEWILVHSLMPVWLRPRAATSESAATNRGVCPFASAIAKSFSADGAERPTAVVLATACDQMRYAAALFDGRGKPPVFLFNVPRTWRTDAARSFYLDELRRLGRFLESLGGVAPSAGALRETMVRYDFARCKLLRRRGEMSAREFSYAVAEMRGGSSENEILGISTKPRPLVAPLESVSSVDVSSGATNGRGFVETAKTSTIKLTPGSLAVKSRENIPLTLVGGPLLEEDLERLDVIEGLGGRIVLDATESGERTLPAPLNEIRPGDDPLPELARIYFDSIPDIFRRPNDMLFDWLASETKRRGARGIIVRRHLWCDIWHAELPRLREECGLPLLDWQQDGDGSEAAFLTRIEAFMEMLGQQPETPPR